MATENRGEIEQALLERLGYGRRDGARYSSGAAVQPIAADWEKRTENRPPTLAADVLVPACQAGVSALAAGAVGFLVGGLTAAIVAACLIFALAWLLLLAQSRAALYAVERIFGRDIDGDGFSGQPPTTRTVRVEMVDQDGRHWRFGTLPVPEETARRVAQAVICDNVNLARKPLNEAGVISQDAYRRLSSWLLDRGLARETANNSRELTRGGEAFFRQLLDE